MIFIKEGKDSMKKLLLTISLFLTSALSYGKNYVFNKTGKTIKIQFHNSYGYTSGVPNYILPGIPAGSSVVPVKIDMHPLASKKMKITCKGIKSATINTPGVTTLNDYQITTADYIDNNGKNKKKFVFKKLDTTYGVKIK